MSRIDEFSRTLGALEESVNGLRRSVVSSRAYADDRHRENAARLGKIEQTQGEILARLARICDDYPSTKQKLDAVEQDVDALKELRNKWAAIIGVFVGALVLIWQGLAYFSGEIRAAIGRLLH